MSNGAIDYMTNINAGVRRNHEVKALVKTMEMRT